jgi:hypothetical protein
MDAAYCRYDQCCPWCYLVLETWCAQHLSFINNNVLILEDGICTAGQSAAVRRC